MKTRWFCSLLLTTCLVFPLPISGQTLELASVFEMPTRTENGTCIGGLSALAYDGEKELYYALSDARESAHFLELDLEIREGSRGDAQIAAAKVSRIVLLKTREGVAYPAGTVDPEGLVLAGHGTAWISSEGVANQGIPPFVDRVALSNGRWLGTVSLPGELLFGPGNGAAATGVRDNLGLETLTITPSGFHLLTAPESALTQDAMMGRDDAVPLMVFRLDDVPVLAGRYSYPLVAPVEDYLVHGLVELAALDDTHYLALERTYGPRIGFVIRLFSAALQPPLDPATAASTGTTVAKTLLIDFKDLSVPLVNYEGMTLGPVLPDGSPSVIVISDNNQTDCSPNGPPPEATVFLLFRLTDG